MSNKHITVWLGLLVMICTAVLCCAFRGQQLGFIDGEAAAAAPSWTDPNAPLAVWCGSYTNSDSYWIDQESDGYVITNYPSVAGGPQQVFVDTNCNGRSEYAFRYDQNDDYSQNPGGFSSDISSNMQAAGSVFIWSKWTYTNNTIEILFNDGWKKGYVMSMVNGALRHLIYDDAEDYMKGEITAANAGLDDDAWHSRCITYGGATNGSDFIVYIDGVTNGSMGYTVSDFDGPGSGGEFTFGRRANSGSYYYKGDLYMIRCYSQELTQAQVMDIHSNTPPVRNLSATTGQGNIEER